MTAEHPGRARAPDLAHPVDIFDFVVYRLHLPYAVLSTHVTGIYEGAFGITRQEWYVLALLAALGELSPTQLADRSAMNLPLTSKTLHSLREKKLIQRETPGADRRRALICLTEAGRALYGSVYEHVAAYNAALVSELTNAECHQLAALLERLHKRALALSREQPAIGAINRRAGGSRRAAQSKGSERK